ncbi:glycoside hydrolase family 30 beta sandwich domain-containing protein [Muriicola sp.]|uniref:glycoside hydrolase family 30 protein n=2 Tax=Muriicola sp. TaxID=2020856 RepID=UPI0035691417
MKKLNSIQIILIISLIAGGCSVEQKLEVQVFETSAGGNKMTPVAEFNVSDNLPVIQIIPDQEYQKITGFGGSFTEASASLLNALGPENRKKVIEAYFGDEGAKYSLTRTHMNSCDFSLNNYSYASVEGDHDLLYFSIDEDKDDIIPFIKEAMEVSSEGFRIVASPWTAPPWMKDNKDWRGGKLLPEYRETWALFFSKYLEAYKEEGIDIWAFTVENEPLGNDYNWESMHFTPKEMTDFVTDYLGPQLEKDGHDVKVLGYDQNREHLQEWVDEMYRDDRARNYFDGTAIHWYASTYEVFPDALQYAHQKAPDKYLIQTEACVDAEVPKWQDDQWYWSKKATDWGWDWAPEKDKHLHPKYVPVYRYARDIIGCLNNWVDGWIDWNMVLDKRGGPNWFENWCVAPVIVDPEKDEVYFTPLYYTMKHFSRFIRPGAVRIGFENPDPSLLITAARNPDGSIVVVALNQERKAKSFDLALGKSSQKLSISPQAIQTIVLK